MREACEVNVEGTKNLIHTISERPYSYFIYISSASVFPGDDPDSFYTENDVPYAKNFYSLTKLLGENVVKNTADLRLKSKIMIVRCNFVSRGKWPYPAAFTDRYGTYLYADQVAGAVINCMQQQMTGTIHVCGDAGISMYELARKNDPDVRPMLLSDYKGPPELNVNMCLASLRIPPIHLA